MIADTKKRPFWYITFKEILALIFAAAVPIALAIYTAISYHQEQQKAEQIRQFDIKQATELRQQPWPFPNAFYRAAHRQWDIIRIADVLQFLKEKKLIGRNNCSSGCRTTNLEDIIRLEELSFDNIHLTSQTGTLSRLNLDCVSFIKVSMTNAAFSFINFNGASFGGRLNNAKFDGVSLVCTTFSDIDLTGTDFGEDSDLTDAHFYNADLTGAKLTKAQRNQAKFYNTIMPDGTSSETSTSTASTKSVSPSTTSKKITTAATTKQITTRITTPIKVLTSEGKLEPPTTLFIIIPTKTVTSKLSIVSTTTFIITTLTETVQSEVKNAPPEVVQSEVEITPTTTFTVTTLTNAVTSDVKLIPTTTLMVTTFTVIDTSEVTTTPATMLIIDTSDVEIVPTTTLMVTSSTVIDTSEVTTTPATTLIIDTSDVEIVPSTTFAVTTLTEVATSEVKPTPATTLSITTSAVTTTSMVTTMKANTKAISICADFNDIPGQSNTSGVIPNGYKNLNWTNAQYINSFTMPVNSGYRAPGIKRRFVAHSRDGDDVIITPTNDAKFYLHNFTMISALQNFLDIDINVVSEGQTIPAKWKTRITSKSSSSTCESCPSVDALKIGVQNRTYPMSRAQDGTQFIITELCFSLAS